MSGCPTQERLMQLLRGELAGAEYPEVEAHVETCADCRGALERLGEGPEEGEWRQRVLEPPAPLPEITLPPPTALGSIGRLAEFDIARELGTGAMGTVYRAYDSHLRCWVAVKVVKPELAAAPRFRSQFEREARAAAAVKSDYVVRIHRVVPRVDGFDLPFLVMELIDGQSLKDRLKREETLPLREVTEIALEIALGLSAIHGCGLVHRDIKPSNVMLDRNTGRARITDFGLARPIIASDDRLTVTGGAPGSPAYMSPEQSDTPDEVDERSDLFSLGVVLYELLTGWPPFRGATPLQTWEQVKTAEPVAPSRLVPGLPRDIETICLKCLEKERAKRYKSAALLADDLRRFLAGEPVWARPVSTVERGWRWCRRQLRNPTAKVAVVAIILSLITSAGVVYKIVQEQARVANVRRQLDSTQQTMRELLSNGDVDAAERVAGAADALLKQEGLQLRQEFGRDVTDGLMLGRLWRVRHPTTQADWRNRDRQAVVPSRYADAFVAYGIEVKNVATAVASIRRSAIRDDLLVALDDWAAATPDRKAREALWAVVDRADPDPKGPLANVRRGIRQGDAARLRALARLEEIRALPPERLVSLAVALRNVGALPDAIELLRDTRRRHRGDRHRGDFWVLLELQADLRLVAKTPEEQAEAIGAREAALDASRVPHLVDFYVGILEFDLGKSSRHGEHFVRSVAAYDQAIAINPGFAPALCNRGNSLTALKRDDEAIWSFHRAVELDPRFARAHFDLAVLFDNRGRVDDAVKEYGKAIRIEPNYAEASINLGLLEYKLGRFGAAADHLKAGADLLDLDDPYRATFKKQGDIARGIAAVEPRAAAVLVRAYTPTAAAEMLSLARLFLHETRRDVARAAELFDAALTREPELADEPGVDNSYAAGFAAAFATGTTTNRADNDRFRLMALKWLRAAVKALERQAEAGGDLAKAATRRQASEWLRGEVFTQIQAVGFLRNLSLAEQIDWKDLVSRLRRLAGE
jgi:serine/threonine protein kinase/tetratricopeptide (TPR) repeat protein